MPTATKPSTSWHPSFAALWCPAEISDAAGFTANSQTAPAAQKDPSATAYWLPNAYRGANFNKTHGVSTGFTTRPNSSKVGGKALNLSRTVLGNPWGLVTADFTATLPSANRQVVMACIRTPVGTGRNSGTGSYAAAADIPTSATPSGMEIVNMSFNQAFSIPYLGLTGKRRVWFRLDSTTDADDILLETDYAVGGGWEVIFYRMNYSDEASATGPITVDAGVYRNGSLYYSTHTDASSTRLGSGGQNRLAISTGGQYRGAACQLSHINLVAGVTSDGVALPTDAEICTAAEWMLQQMGYVVPTKSLLLCGDSLMYGWYAPTDATFCSFVGATLEPQGVMCTPIAWPGSTAQEVAADTTNLVACCNLTALHAGLSITQTVACLAWGVNDIAGGRTAAQIYADLGTIAAALRAAGVQSIIGIVPPSVGTSTHAKEVVRRDLRALMVADASGYFSDVFNTDTYCPELVSEWPSEYTSNALPFIAAGGADIMHQITGNAAVTNRVMDSAHTYGGNAVGADGIHLGPVGYARWGTALANSTALLGDNGLGILQTGYRPRARGWGVR